jgi:hypothetical protein
MREIEKTKPTTHFQKVTTTVKYCHHHHHHHQMNIKSELLDPVLTHLRKLASVKGDLRIRKRRGCEADQQVRACDPQQQQQQQTNGTQGNTDT